MEPFTYFLAFSRLASVQCSSFGHPDTSGIRNIDYFISDDLFEPGNAQEHYSEKLLLLRNCGNLVYYYKPELPNPPKRRDAFNLPEQTHLYLCLQTLFKFHPEFDAFLASILRSDPLGLLVLVHSKIPRWTELLMARFRQTMPDVLERIVFLPQQKGTDFVNLLAVSDVMLDTLHFNGYNTSLEAFAVGTPVVTLPTALQRGRHTAGMYRKMGIEDCIARNREEYVNIAVRLGTQPDVREALRNRILAANSVLYENMQVVREFERLFVNTVTHPTP